MAECHDDLFLLKGRRQNVTQLTEPVCQGKIGVVEGTEKTGFPPPRE